jgi:hypothetical protein
MPAFYQLPLCNVIGKLDTTPDFFRSLFKPRRKCHKINPALAAEAAPQTAMPLFPQPVKAVQNCRFWLPRCQPRRL